MCFRFRLRAETAGRLTVLNPNVVSGVVTVSTRDMVTRSPHFAEQPICPRSELGACSLLSQLTGSGLGKVPHNLREKAQGMSASCVIFSLSPAGSAGTCFALAPARTSVLFKARIQDLRPLAVERD